MLEELFRCRKVRKELGTGFSNMYSITIPIWEGGWIMYVGIGTNIKNSYPNYQPESENVNCICTAPACPYIPMVKDDDACFLESEKH